MMSDTHNDYPYRDTAAAQMLSSALQRKQSQGVSLRKLAPQLGYKQAAVLSHMANGRIPVPTAKAQQIATVAGLPAADFVRAVWEQRHPDTHMFATGLPLLFEQPRSFAAELEDIADQTLDDLTAEQKDVMRKAAVDPAPARRWLSEAELPVMSLLRRLRPGIAKDGLSPHDRDSLARALQSKEGDVTE